MLGAGEPGKAKKVSIIAAIFACEYKFLTTQMVTLNQRCKRVGSFELSGSFG